MGGGNWLSQYLPSARRRDHRVQGYFVSILCFFFFVWLQQHQRQSTNICIATPNTKAYKKEEEKTKLNRGNTRTNKIKRFFCETECARGKTNTNAIRVFLHPSRLIQCSQWMIPMALRERERESLENSARILQGKQAKVFETSKESVYKIPKTVECGVYPSQCQAKLEQLIRSNCRKMFNQLTCD